MKQALFLMLLFTAYTADAQSLKDALYGGKLKNEAGSVIRKTDDLSTKIDTTTRKTSPVDSVRLKATAETVPKKQAAPNTAAPTAVFTDSVVGSAGGQHIPLPVAEEPAVVPVVPAPKDNNALWKEYITAVQPTLKTEVLPSKKVKKGTYSVMVSYTIDTDGQTAVSDVFVAPDNDYLKEQVKNRLTDSPKLAPVLNSAGTARKVTKRYSFTVTKD